MIRESDITYQNGDLWVLKSRDAYTVVRDGATFATSDSSYAPNPDGLSIAKARCDYLAGRAREAQDGRMRKGRLG